MSLIFRLVSIVDCISIHKALSLRHPRVGGEKYHSRNLEATENYSEAVKMFSFSVRNKGKAAYCGVFKNGEPFHGETEA